MFTDESAVQFYLNMNRQNTRFRSTSRSAVPVTIVKHSGGGHVLIAGGLTTRGLTKLFVVPKDQKVNGAFYRSYMLPFYKAEGERLYGDRFPRLKLMEDPVQRN